MILVSSTTVLQKQAALRSVQVVVMEIVFCADQCEKQQIAGTQQSAVSFLLTFTEVFAMHDSDEVYKTYEQDDK